MPSPRTFSPSVIQRAQDLNQKRAESIDGHPRSSEREKEINRAVHAVLNTGDGQILMEWIREITTNKVLGANATPQELAYQEGMRMIAALLDMRHRAQKTYLTKKQVKHD